MAEDLEAAGRAIEEVRVDRGLTQAEAAAAAGVSGTSWNVAANGRERLSPRIAGKVMKWCGWTAASYERLLEGLEPERHVRSEFEQDVADLAERSAIKAGAFRRETELDLALRVTRLEDAMAEIQELIRTGLAREQATRTSATPSGRAETRGRPS